jgi:hypothetical protein
MAGHEIEKGEIQLNATQRLHDDIKKNVTQIQKDIDTQTQEDCNDQYFECVSECNINDRECEAECVTNLKECDLPWEEEDMTIEEDKFITMDEGELISEILQIAALLGGTCERTTTLNSTGRESKKIIIEYDIRSVVNEGSS